MRTARDWIRDGNRSYYDRPEVRAQYREQTGLTPAETTLLAGLPPHAEVLDIGCGAGRVALELAALGHRSIGVDHSPGMVEEARAAARARHQEVRFLVADACRLPFAARSFDAVVFLGNGINHLPAASLATCLAELCRVCRDDGTVILGFRSPYALNRLAFGLGRRALRQGIAHARGRVVLSVDEIPGPPHYLHRPSSRRLADAASSAGFGDVRVGPWRLLAGERRLGPLAPHVGGQFYLCGRPAARPASTAGTASASRAVHA